MIVKLRMQTYKNVEFWKGLMSGGGTARGTNVQGASVRFSLADEYFK